MFHGAQQIEQVDSVAMDLLKPKGCALFPCSGLLHDTMHQTKTDGRCPAQDTFAVEQRALVLSHW